MILIEKSHECKCFGYPVIENSSLLLISVTVPNDRNKMHLGIEKSIFFFS